MIEGLQKQNARISKDIDIRVHVNICSPVRMHVCISPSSKDMVIRACARNIMHVHTRIYMHTCTHACIHAYLHTYIPTCIPACIRMKNFRIDPSRQFVYPGSPTPILAIPHNLTSSPNALRIMASSTKAPRPCPTPPRKLEAWAALARNSDLSMA